jgi:hypothetical protein
MANRLVQLWSELVNRLQILTAPLVSQIHNDANTENWKLYNIHTAFLEFNVPNDKYDRPRILRTNNAT